MEDLSGLAANSMWPTSQLSGGRPSDNSTARTAPGTPSAGADETDLDRQPFVQPIDHEEATPTRADATGLRGGRPVLRTGGWNDMGGGPAPEGYRHA